MTTTTYLWDTESDNLLSEDDGSSAMTYTNEPTHFGDLVSQNNSLTSNTNFYHFDARGDTRELTDVSEAVTDTRLYDAWGNVLASTGATIMPFQFVGRLGYVFDSKLDLTYVRARWYAAAEGRWEGVDPLHFSDGTNGCLYVINNAIYFYDPSGKIKITAVEEIPNPLENTVCPKTATRINITWDFIPQSKGGKLGAPCDGYMIQKIQTWCDVKDCEDCPKKIPSDGKPNYAFYEAWFFKQGQRFDEERRDSVGTANPLNFTDSATATIRNNSCGYRHVTGEVRFYCLKDIPDVKKTWKFNQSSGVSLYGQGLPGGCLTVVSLPTTNDPKLVTFWDNKKPADGPAKRVFSSLYNCCPCVAKKPTVTASPRLAKKTK